MCPNKVLTVTVGFLLKVEEYSGDYYVKNKVAIASYKYCEIWKAEVIHVRFRED